MKVPAPQSSPVQYRTARCSPSGTTTTIDDAYPLIIPSCSPWSHTHTHPLAPSPYRAHHQRSPPPPPLITHPHPHPRERGKKKWEGEKKKKNPPGIPVIRKRNYSIKSAGTDVIAPPPHGTSTVQQSSVQDKCAKQKKRKR